VDAADELNAVRPYLSALDYAGVRERCNDQTHHNFLDHLLLNDGRAHLRSRVEWIGQLGTDTLDIIMLHLAYSFCLSGHYMMSSDYMDALEAGIAPEHGSEDWVAPSVQMFLSEKVEPRCPGLIAALRQETGMELEGWAGWSGASLSLSRYGSRLCPSQTVCDGAAPAILRCFVQSRVLGVVEAHARSRARLSFSALCSATASAK
jgi:hypothetical protein